MEQNINNEITKLEILFSWYEFYTQNKIEANKCQKQIEDQKRHLKALKAKRYGKTK
jgi:hypothetical protein